MLSEDNKDGDLRVNAVPSSYVTILSGEKDWTEIHKILLQWVILSCTIIYIF